MTMEERIETEIAAVNEYYDKKLSVHMLNRHLGKLELLCELTNTPFPYNKLHMGFATMD